MPSIIPGFEYDIFISYRHNDNLDGWVTEFVQNLEKELRSTLKDIVTIYFDKNPHDGLLETHNVDKSLEGKLKCLIFIPIISQTYCDTKSFAWQYEFVAFNKLASGNFPSPEGEGGRRPDEGFGRDIKLSNGNVASRILPIKIHDLDAEDKSLLESELGGVLRAIEFIYKEAGVNRPLKATDVKTDNQNKTDYRNQVNKVANAIKEIINAIKNPNQASHTDNRQPVTGNKLNPSRKKAVIILLAVLLIAVTGYFFYQQRATNNEQETLDKSIAVLPFVNMSNDPGQEYFSDGMTDEVLNRLFKIGSLKVISRTSSMKFKGAKLTAKEIAQQLGVTNILEGSIQNSGNRIKVTVQLIDAVADNHLWSETYEREFIDIFSIQADIATAVARELKIKLSQESHNDLAAIPTQSKSAYQFFLKGKDYASKLDENNAILMYSNAIKEDSLFSLAYAKRAQTHIFQTFDPRKLRQNEIELASKDIESLKRIRPDLPELKLVLVFWHVYISGEYNKALELLNQFQFKIPNDPDLHYIKGVIMRAQGKWDESIFEYEEAMRLDPLNANIFDDLCNTYNILHRYKDVLELAIKGKSLIPEFTGFKSEIFNAEINLCEDIVKAIETSGLTEEEQAGNAQYLRLNKKYLAMRLLFRKRGVHVTSGMVGDYRSTFEIARVYFWEGNRPMAKVYADSAISFFEKKLPEMMDDPKIYSTLGVCYAISGHEKKAIEYGRKAMELFPTSLDAWIGPIQEGRMAEIYIILGKYDLALEKIERLLSIPSHISACEILVEPMYEPLRNLPRFKKLVEKYKYKSKG